MLKKYTISMNAIGLDKPRKLRSVLLVNHTREDLRLVAGVVFEGAGWFDQLVLGTPESRPGRTLFAVSADSIEVMPTVDWVVHVYEDAPSSDVRFLTVDGCWISLEEVFGLSYYQRLLDESDWRVVRELEKLFLPKDHPLFLERESYRARIRERKEE